MANLCDRVNAAALFATPRRVSTSARQLWSGDRSEQDFKATQSLPAWIVNRRKNNANNHARRGLLAIDSSISLFPSITTGVPCWSWLGMLDLLFRLHIFQKVYAMPSPSFALLAFTQYSADIILAWRANNEWWCYSADCLVCFLYVTELSRMST